ncbi:MAG: ComEA family DNA-binding protein [Planctomycetota bacterium]
MTPRGARRGREASGRLAGGLGDAAFFALALAFVVVPPWLRSGSRGPAELWRGAAGPAKIDVNAAPWYEWTLLEGVGEVRARRIVRDREAKGPFRCLEELDRVPGMPRGWWEKSRDHLSVGAPQAE